jgi:hypothetical protein
MINKMAVHEAIVGKGSTHVKKVLTVRIKTPLSESASELYRPSDRRLSADCQLSAVRGCHVVSVTGPYSRILGFLDRSRYFSIK